MADLSEKIGYLRGLVSSMELDQESANAKLLKGIVDALEGVLDELGDMREDLSELNDFVESIDEDLEDLEAMHDSEEGSVEFSDDEDDDFDDEEFAPEEGLRVLSPKRAESSEEEALIGSICPECGKLFFAPLEGSDAPDALYKCPLCEKEVPLNPLGPENAPIAKRTDKTK